MKPLDTRLLRVFAAVWLLLIAALSLIPLSLKFRLHTIGHLHNGAHFFVFLVAMTLVGWNAAARTARLKLCCWLILFGLTMELGEVAIYHNPFEWLDLLLDGCGVVSGLSLLAIRDRTKSAVPSR